VPETPQELLNIGTSYEEVMGQLRGAAGLDGESGVDGGVLDGGGRGYDEAARDMGVSREMLRGDSDQGAAPPAPMPAPPRRAGARDEDARVRARAEELAAAAAAAAGSGGGAQSVMEPNTRAVDEAPDGALGAFDRMADTFDFDQQRQTVGAVDDVKAAETGDGSGARSVLEENTKPVDEAPDGALGAFDRMAETFDFDQQRQTVGAVDDVKAAETGGGSGARSVLEENTKPVDEAPDGALGAFDRMAETFDFDQQRKTVKAVDDVAAAPPAGLGDASAPVKDALKVQDEAPDGALGAFDRMAETFDFDQQRKTVKAVDDVAAAPPIGLGDAAAPVKDATNIQDEAPDGALSRFDHEDFAPPRAAAAIAAAAAAAAAASAAARDGAAAPAALAPGGAAGGEPQPVGSVLQWLVAGALALLASGGGMIYLSEHPMEPKEAAAPVSAPALQARSPLVSPQ
jgi:hypothetical protein